MSNLTKINKLTPFGKFCVTIGNLPASYMESLTYEEQLLWFCNFLENEVIPAVNNNAGAVEELQNLYIQLKNYVDNYFENLNVQEEINNKLDAMAIDGTLSRIINDELLNNINTNIININNKIKHINKYTPNLEYMFTHHTDKDVFQGLCCDENYYYYANATNNSLSKIFKRSLASNELINIYEDIDFRHCNDMSIINDIIYSANIVDSNNDFTRGIGVFNTITNSQNKIFPFETEEIVNEGFLFVSSLTKYDENHLLCVLLKDYNNMHSMGLFLLDLRNNSYQKININNVEYMKNKTWQSCEYVNEKLYFICSNPTTIHEFYEENNEFFYNTSYSYENYDLFGQNIGEMEGIALLPEWYNGNNTLLLYSQVKRFNGNNKTLKFYCVNPETNLPLSANNPQTEGNYPSLLSNITVKQEATNYYEDGSSAYPFKDLLSALECLNFSNLRKSARINLYKGTYNIYDIRNMKVILIGQEADIIINGNCNLQYLKDNCYIGGSNEIIWNNNNFNIVGTNILFNNVNFNDNSINVLDISFNSNVYFKNCIASLNNYIAITDSQVHTHFSQILRKSGSLQFFEIRDGGVLYNSNTLTLVNTNVNRTSGGIGIMPGWVNV